MMFHFLWGGKRDKIKRDIVIKSKELGGLDMINFKSFVVSLKVKLLFKLFDQNFHHPWKDILTNQLKFPDHLAISVECGVAASGEYAFTQDLLNCFQYWRSESSTVSNKTPDHCIWFNKSITDIGRLLWNDNLISRKVFSISDFVDDNGDILTYQQFRIKHRIRKEELSMTDYGSMKLALKRFNTPSITTKSLNNIDQNLGIRFFVNASDEATPRSSKEIRSCMISDEDPSNHLQMSTWNQHLPETIHKTWKAAFFHLIKASNNFKLIQHQFKILYRIATSRYLRFKMKIDGDPNCPKCGELETLEHIYINCQYSLDFVSKVHSFITANLDSTFNDHEHVIRLGCIHPNQAIIFMLLTCNWYIGRQYQRNKGLYWEPYVRFCKQFLNGEKLYIVNQINNSLHYTNG